MAPHASSDFEVLNPPGPAVPNGHVGVIQGSDLGLLGILGLDGWTIPNQVGPGLDQLDKLGPRAVCYGSPAADPLPGESKPGRAPGEHQMDVHPQKYVGPGTSEQNGDLFQKASQHHGL